MKRRTLSIAALVCGASSVGLFGSARLAHSSDHMDSPATTADPAADINDVYGWMSGNDLVLAMTLFPNAMGASDAGPASAFSNAVQYVFHTSSGAAFSATTANEDIICTFDVTQNISCWVGTDEYVTGDASGLAGFASADGKFKVFAGLRADPFFFNLDGFNNTVSTVEAVAGAASYDVAGCPTLSNVQGALLRTDLMTETDAGTATDFFAKFNALAIVVSVDKSLVTKGGPVLSTWSSTNKAM